MEDPIEKATGWQKVLDNFYVQPAEQRADAYFRDMKEAQHALEYHLERCIEADIHKARRLTRDLLSALVTASESEREQIAESALCFAVWTLRHDPLERLLESVRQAYAAANGPGDSEKPF